MDLFVFVFLKGTVRGLLSSSPEEDASNDGDDEADDDEAQNDFAGSRHSSGSLVGVYEIGSLTIPRIGRSEGREAVRLRSIGSRGPSVGNSHRFVDNRCSLEQEHATSGDYTIHGDGIIFLDADLGESVRNISSKWVFWLGR